MEKTFVNEFGKTYSKVILHAAQRAIVMEWYGYTTKHQIEEVALWVESFNNEVSFDTILNDCTYIISVWDESIDWFSKVWLVRMRRLGVVRFIHIAKPSSFGDRIGQHLGSKKHANMEYLFFSTSKEVGDWLRLHDNEGNISVD
ncbi:hypothetical protein [Pontibacter litorisediminis]|uniref:hypothetical protein n=1 Tax=Pontibacter litorisediminis TaxID=1846260 RepID=UPI0023EA9CCD|nr:hypothetical protein [Pontibacter litorisediminis]